MQSPAPCASSRVSAPQVPTSGCPHITSRNGLADIVLRHSIIEQRNPIIVEVRVQSHSVSQSRSETIFLGPSIRFYYLRGPTATSQHVQRICSRKKVAKPCDVRYLRIPGTFARTETVRPWSRRFSPRSAAVGRSPPLFVHSGKLSAPEAFQSPTGTKTG